MNQQHHTLLMAAEGALEVGNSQSAENMLRRLLKEAPRTAEAWYLLSLALESWTDQTACLRNALAVDPDLEKARTRLDALEAEGAGSAAWQGKLTVAVLEDARKPGFDDFAFISPMEEYGVDPLDNPLQCPYCGTVNPVDKKICTHCAREIVFPRPKSEVTSPQLKLAVVLAGMAGMFGLFEILTGGLWQWLGELNQDSWLLVGLLASAETEAWHLLFGAPQDPEFLTEAGASVLVLAGVARLVLFGAAWYGARSRWRWGFYAAQVVCVADILFQLVLAAMGVVGRAIAVLAAVFSAGALAMLYAARGDFAVDKVRIAVQPESKYKSASSFYRQGMKYKSKGMWALAVANFRRAVGAAPREVEYSRWLGIGYIRLGRYDRAVSVLEEASRMAPTNPEFDELLLLIKDIMAKEARGEQVDREQLIAPLWENEA